MLLKLLSAQAGAKSPQAAYYFYWGKQLQGVRSGQWKLYFPRTYPSMAGKMGGTDGRPVVPATGKAGLELYDLQTDESETTNVADRHPEVVRRLQGVSDGMRALDLE